VAEMTQLVVEPGRCFASKDHLEAIATNSTKSLGYKSLKEKQLKAMVSLMQLPRESYLPEVSEAI